MNVLLASFILSQSIDILVAHDRINEEHYCKLMDMIPVLPHLYICM